MEKKDPEEKLNPTSDELSTSALVTLTKQRRQLLEEAKANILKAQDRRKQDYDRRRADPAAYDIGSKVLKKDFLRKKCTGGKMDAKYLGPYIITKHLGKGLYSLQLVADPTHTIQRVNGAHLKPYHTLPSSPPHSDDKIHPSTSLSPQNSNDSIHNTNSTYNIHNITDSACHQHSNDSIPSPMPPLNSTPLKPYHTPPSSPAPPAQSDDQINSSPSLTPQSYNDSIHQHPNDSIPSPLPPLHSNHNKVSLDVTCSYMYK